MDIADFDKIIYDCDIEPDYYDYMSPDMQFILRKVYGEHEDHWRLMPARSNNFEFPGLYDPGTLDELQEKLDKHYGIKGITTED